MKRQDYIKEMRSSIEEYLEGCINDGMRFSDVDFDDLINYCSGNADGSYTMNRMIAEENINECPELVVEALTYYGYSVGEIEEAEHVDVIIRMFVIENELDVEEVFNEVVEDLINDDINDYLNGEDKLNVIKKFIYYPEQFKKVADGPDGFAGLYGVISQEAEEMLKNSIRHCEKSIKHYDEAIERAEDYYNSGEYDSKKTDRLIEDAILLKKIETKTLEKYKKLDELINRREYPDEYEDIDLIQNEIYKIGGVI